MRFARSRAALDSGGSFRAAAARTTAARTVAFQVLKSFAV
jgi:hypothetical protein